MVRNTDRLSVSVFLNPLNIFSINLIEVNKDVLGIFLDADSALRGLNHSKTHWPICVTVEKSYGHFALKWRQNERDGVSNHRRLNCLPNRLFRRRSKKTSKLRVTGLCEGNSLVTSEFSVQRASNDDVAIWWSHHGQNVLASLSPWDSENRLPSNL